MAKTRFWSALAGAVLSAAAVSAFAGPATQPTTRPYPLKTCVVSGDKLGDMGKPVVLNYEGREVQLCCKGCVDDFKQDPAKYLKKLDEAQAAATTKPAEGGEHKGHGGHKH